MSKSLMINNQAHEPIYEIVFETAFEKLGACASYIVRDGEVRTIGAATLPVGVLPDVESRSLRMTLQAGDVVVMMADGVRDAYQGGEIALREDIG